MEENNENQDANAAMPAQHPLPTNEQPQVQGPVERPSISLTKLILIGVLGGFALFLQFAVYNLEIMVEERRIKQAQKLAEAKSDNEYDGVPFGSSPAATIKPSALNQDPTKLHTHRMTQGNALTGQSKSMQSNAFWKQAAELWLASWDPNVPQHEFAATPSVSSSMTTATGLANLLETELDSEDWKQNRTLAWHALERAAEMGHPYAQFHVANAYSSGIFLGDAVQDTWTVPESAQQQKAWLLWHMAAIGGNVEAALAMGSRLEDRGATCQEVLPYYQEAAMGIIDALEADPQSRAKVVPATDKHILYQIHLHGGTPSKLDYHNKADESPEALQFYHLRAMSTRDKESAAGAAYTLANYYHHGVRGATQNITLAAEYYERAANLNHWEAAGELGTFYMWGIGVPRDVYKAHKFFRMGMPIGISGCQRRYQARLNKNKDSENSDSLLSLCDTESLNGMGLLKLFGLPHVMKSDPVKAEELFLMARDQGSADAAFNHAMMKLGWTQHWQPISSLSDDGKTEINPLSSTPPSHHPTLGEYQAVLTDLTMAAGKGHIQSRLRLGLLFAKGVKVPSGSPGSGTAGGETTAVTKDCAKAVKQFKWIAESACPQRTKRLRRAYKQYMAGDTEASLLNYLAAAETGSNVGLLNAAFLLEQGECFSSSVFQSEGLTDSVQAPLLSSVDCAKASARLWKAAAAKGHGEASLRVGDFYYYQKFREHTAESLNSIGPFGWIRYLLYPEETLPLLLKNVQSYTDDLLAKLDAEQQSTADDGDEQVCKVDMDSQTCSIDDHSRVVSEEERLRMLESDLEMAAHYYQLASETSDSARAHFNLGFLYEWGLGLKQDFPLAKRHYDLAVSSGNSREAELPVAIALLAMSIHETCLKMYRSFKMGFDDGREMSESIFGPIEGRGFDVLQKHVFAWDSLLLLILTLVLFFLVRIHGTHRRP